MFSRMPLKTCRTLMESMQLNSHIISLDLSGKAMGDEGAVFVGEMLKHNKSLLSLDLSGNMLMVQVRKATACMDSYRSVPTSAAYMLL